MVHLVDITRADAYLSLVFSLVSVLTVLTVPTVMTAATIHQTTPTGWTGLTSLTAQTRLTGSEMVLTISWNWDIKKKKGKIYI